MKLLLFCIFLLMLLFALIYKLIGNSKVVLRLSIPKRKFYSGEDLEVVVHCYFKKRLEGLSAILFDFSLGDNRYPKYQKKQIVKIPYQLEPGGSLEEKVIFKVPYWEELKDRIEDPRMDNLSYQLNYYVSGSIKATLPLEGVDSYKLKLVRVHLKRQSEKKGR